MRCLSGNHNHNHLDNRLLPAVTTPDMWSVNPPSLIHDQGSKQGPSEDQSGTVAPGRQIQWSWPWGLASYSLFVTVSLVSFAICNFSPCKWENRIQPFRGPFSVGHKFPFYDFRKLFISVSLSPLCFRRAWNNDPVAGKGAGLFGWVGTAGEGIRDGRPALRFSWNGYWAEEESPTWVKMSWIGQMRWKMILGSLFKMRGNCTVTWVFIPHITAKEGAQERTDNTPRTISGKVMIYCEN